MMVMTAGVYSHSAAGPQSEESQNFSEMLVDSVNPV
jgi:hypothetical protein